ncbi:MAG: hypothetical protein WC616_04265 [Candidatus Omnitrophota bacterium]
MKCGSFFNKAIVLLVLVLCFIIAFGQGIKPGKNFIDADELLYVYYAGLFKSFFITHNFDNVFWHSDFNCEPAPVGVYVIGLTLFLSPYSYMLAEPTKLFLFTGPNNVPHSGFERWQDIQQHPFPYVREMISILRPRMLIFRAFCYILVFIFSWYLGTYFCAALSLYFFLNNGMFLWFSSFVLLESVWLFEHLLNLLLIFLFLSLWQKEKRPLALLLFLSFSIGLTQGLLAGTKIHGALNIVILAVCLFLICVRQLLLRKVTIRDLLLLLTHLGIVVCVSFVVFAALNPMFFNANHFLVIREIIKTRFSIFAHQAAYYPDSALPTILSRLNYVVQRFISVELNPAECLLFLVGLFFLVLNAWRTFLKQGKVGICSLILVGFFTELGAILFFMQAAAVRYLVVLTPYLSLFMGYGVYSLGIEICRMIERRRLRM